MNQVSSDPKQFHTSGGESPLKIAKKILEDRLERI